MVKRIYKVESDKKIFGVCGGIAEYFNMDPTIIRIAWAIFTLLICGTGVLIYIICAFVFPNKSEVENINNNNDNNNNAQ